jgi:putative phage-type endonuclease
MQIHKLTPGTPEWLKFRADYFTASEAPAMMGVSPYKTRSELLAEKATGAVREPSESEQRLFDKGHAAEAKARANAEELIGAELYPVTGSVADLSASFDGLTMDGRVAWEHKLWNDAKAQSVLASKVPDADWWQVQQQLLVSGAEYCLYMVSDGGHDSCATMKVEPDTDAFKALRSGWDQFKADMAEYQPDEKLEATAQPIESLPTLAVELAGEVRSSNLATYKDVVEARIAAINTDLQTDQDFADAEQMVKFLDSGEKEIETVKKQALAQTATIDDLFRTLDHLRESMRGKRLELNRLVKARKDAIRVEIRDAAQAKVDAHIAKINESLGGKVMLPVITPNFASAMKGKKTVSSLKSACDDEVARVKIEASEIGDRIRGNLEHLRNAAEGIEFLFRDVQQLVNKEPEDFENLVKARIAEHEAEQKRIAEDAAERERRRIEHEQQEAARRAAGKCDGNHGGPICADPECWARDDAPAAPQTTSSAPKPVYTGSSDGQPTRHSIIRLVADAYNLSDSAAERAISEIFAKEAA